MMNQMKQEMLSSTLFGLRAYTPEELASIIVDGMPEKLAEIFVRLEILN